MSDPRIAALTQLLADTEGGGYSEHAYRLIEAGVRLPGEPALGSYYRKEIARLRRIEEAARTYLDVTGFPMWGLDTEDTVHVRKSDLAGVPEAAAALRAELEEKP